MKGSPGTLIHQFYHEEALKILRNIHTVLFSEEVVQGNHG